MTEPKLCKCGCGQPAPIASRTRRTRGEIKGQPLDYIPHHNLRARSTEVAQPAETVYCQCGCGKPVPIAQKTQSSRGVMKGQPLRYVHGHYIKEKRRSATRKAWVTRKTKTGETIKAKGAKKNGGKPRFVQLEEAVKAESTEKTSKCSACGVLFPVESKFGISSLRCPACKEKSSESKRGVGTASCSWCGEEAAAHSGSSLKPKLWACLKCWEKLKSALRNSMQGEENLFQARA